MELIKGVRRRLGIDRIEKLDRLINMDQTMVRFSDPSGRTNNLIGERSVRISKSSGAKRGLTVALTATASGRKLKLMIIFKEASGRIPPRVYQNLTIPANVVLAATSSGWMSVLEMSTWISRVLGE